MVPTDWAGIDRPALGLLLVAVAFAFVGFETTAAYGEEARRPRRSITRATLLAVGLLSLLYAASAWAMSIASRTGPDLGAVRRARLGAGVRPGRRRGSRRGR